MRVAIVAMAMAGFACQGYAATTIEIDIDVRGTVRTVVIELNEAAAPKTCANFEKLCSQGFYSGMAFHRVIPNYIVQVGDPLSKDKSKKSLWGTGGPGYTLPAELGGSHLKGSVAMARIPGPSNPTKESSGSQFYFALRDIPSLDGDYTVFGKVLSGLEAIAEIAALPKDENFNPIDRIEILSTKIRGAEAAPAPAPSPENKTTSNVLPPMPDLGAAQRAKEAENAIPSPAVPPATAVAAADPAPATTVAPPAPADRGLPPMPKLFTENSTPPPAPKEASPQPAPTPTAKPVEMPPATPADGGLPPMPKLFSEKTTSPPAPEEASPQPSPTPTPKPVEMPPAAPADGGLPPMPKLFSEKTTPPPAPEEASPRPTPKPVEMPPAPPADGGLPPMPKLFTGETTPPPPLPAPVPSTPETASPTPDPKPVAISRPVAPPEPKPVSTPSATDASSSGNSAEGVTTIAEIGTSISSPATPAYQAPKPAPASAPATASPRPTQPGPTAPAPSSNPENDPYAQPGAETQPAMNEPPKRGFLGRLIERLW